MPWDGKIHEQGQLRSHALLPDQKQKSCIFMSEREGQRGCAIWQGAYVANYPWDGTTDKSTRYAACPDDTAFMHMARAYASLHGKMNTSTEFIEGITNGAAWYPLWGGMQVTHPTSS